MSKTMQWVIGILAVLALGAGITFLILYNKKKKENEGLGSVAPKDDFSKDVCNDTVKEELRRIKLMISQNPFGNTPEARAEVIRLEALCAGK